MTANVAAAATATVIADRVVRGGSDDGGSGEAAWGAINVRGASLPH